MRVWKLPAAEPTRRMGDAILADLIGCIGEPAFGLLALERLNRTLPAASWSVYRVHADQPPALCASASLGIPDTTQDCFHAYRAGLYRADHSFAQARSETGQSEPVLAHCRAEDIQSAQREQIYFRYGMRERLSVVSAEPDGLLAVNLYRHSHQAAFEAGDVEVLQHLGLGLLACVKRHLSLIGTPAPEVAPLDALRRHCPTLTDRELQVCDGLLRGWTHDGIAAELRLSVTTVKTYRNRAFDRLGIHFRNQLFDVVRSRPAPVTH